MISGAKRIVRRPYPMSNSGNQYNTAEARELHLCNGFRPEHGLNTPLDSAQGGRNVHHHFPIRQNNRLPMGYGGPADIFKSEMMKLMEALDYVRAHIDDLLVITRGTL